MESRQNKPLTDEERAAVEKAMAEFGENSFEWNPSAPKKRKKTTAPKPVFQISPLVRNILIAAVMLGILVGLLSLILGGGIDKALSPTTPVSTLPPAVNEERPSDGTVIVVPPTTESPTEVPVPPDTQPTQPVESTPPVTVPTEPPTEPDPFAGLSEGAALSSGDVAYFQALFHPDSVYASISRYHYLNPASFQLPVYVAAGAPSSTPYQPTAAEAAYLSQFFDSFKRPHLYSITRTEAISILDKYFGLTLDDISAGSVFYWEETDRYYYRRDPYMQDLIVTHGTVLPNGNICVCYVEKNSHNAGAMILSGGSTHRVVVNAYSSMHTFTIKNAYLDKYATNSNCTIWDLVVNYYGFYEGAYVCFVDDPFYAENIDIVAEDIIGGLPFRYENGQKLLVFIDEQLIPLTDAFEAGIFSKAALQQLHTYYQTQHPQLYAPQEPPVEWPEGTSVSSEELSHLQSLFSGYSVYASMSRYDFTDPATIGLQALTAADIRPDSEILLSDQELQYLAGISEAYLYLDVCILPKYEAEEILQQYYGLKLEDVPSAKDAVYYGKTNCYYFIEEAFISDLSVTHAVTLPNGNIWVRYVDKFSGRIGHMILSNTEYHILENTVD